MSKVLEVIDKIEHMDRRLWGIFVLFTVCFPMVFPLGLPLKVTWETQMFYDYVQKLPDGANIVVKTAAGTLWSEHGPGQLAVLKHFFSKNVRILFWGGEQIAQFLVNTYFPMIEASPKYGPYFKQKVYGVDYLVLPYMPGGLNAQVAFAGNAFQLFAGTKDYLGIGFVNDFPIMQHFKTAYDWTVYFVNGGEPAVTTEMQIYTTTYHVPFLVSALSSNYMLYHMYLQSGQFVGIQNGMRGGAEYEKLIVEPTSAGAGGMDILSLTYTFIWITYLLFNVPLIIRKLNARRGVKK